MKVCIRNEGDLPVRVIADHDTGNDFTPEAGAEKASGPRGAPA
jgi:hypothetical protein